jgi:hypothetical protein
MISSQRIGILMLAVASLSVVALVAAAVATPTQQAFALQVVSNKNQAGGNTQEGLVNVGNAQVNVGANVCALAEDC